MVSQMKSPSSLNESPSKKEGKSVGLRCWWWTTVGLNESPSQKEGKCGSEGTRGKPPACLNESPSQKEGKSPGGAAPLY